MLAFFREYLRVSVPQILGRLDRARKLPRPPLRAVRRKTITQLTEDVDDVATRFLFELIGRRYMSHSTVLCAQYTPSEWHGRLGGVQADAMTDRLIHGSVRIDLGDVNVRKLLSSKG